MARPEFMDSDHPDLPWTPALVVGVDKGDPVPWLVRIQGQPKAHWRIPDAVRSPETDEEWAAITAYQLTEGTSL